MAKDSCPWKKKYPEIFSNPNLKVKFHSKVRGSKNFEKNLVLLIGDNTTV